MHTDFLSIDCGLDDKYSGYPDHSTGIFYVSDGPYVDTGENHAVEPEYQSKWRRQYHTVLSFPSGVRNCYMLPTEAGAKYLVRLDLAYGNHDGRNYSSSMNFDFYLGTNYWGTYYVAQWQMTEALFIAWASWAPVCLWNTGHGVPFLSLLELRKLSGVLYPSLTISHAMSVHTRENMGGRSSPIRYVSLVVIYYYLCSKV